MNTTAKTPKRPVNGVLLLDKASGLSSNAALQQVRRLYRAEKAGHTGVLDPLATGLLPICFGEAAKFAQYLLDADKAYTATLRLGESSSTGDAEGQITASCPHLPDKTAFQVACRALLGPQRQIPPMYSALKHRGKALYEYARQGINIERPPRDIIIHHIRLQHYDPPCAVIDVSCSKGTYIRTLAEDIAAQAGTLAHLTALRRTETAGFTLADSYRFDRLAGLDETERDRLLLPCDSLVRHLPACTLSAAAAADIRCGRITAGPNTAASGILRAYTETGTFIGLVQEQATGYLKALRLMNTAAANADTAL